MDASSSPGRNRHAAMAIFEKSVCKYGHLLISSCRGIGLDMSADLMSANSFSSSWPYLLAAVDAHLKIGYIMRVKYCKANEACNILYCSWSWSCLKERCFSLCWLVAFYGNVVTNKFDLIWEEVAVPKFPGDIVSFGDFKDCVK
eukprot:3162433-Ditylum_brightwellii.AAC.1